MNRFVTGLFLFVVLASNGQLILYQDVFNGGMTGGGGSMGSGSGTLTFDISIEPGSVIRKAYFIAGCDGKPDEISVVLNGESYQFGDETIYTSGFNSLYSSINTSSVHAIEVTDLINPSTVNYSLSVPSQQIIGSQAFTSFYLVVAYENPSLSPVAVNIVLNQTDVGQVIPYHINNLLPIDTSNDVGFAFVGSHFCNNTTDGSFVYINNSNLGLVGGNDVNSNWFCSGTQGHFFYQNNTFVGLSDDVANTIMNGADAIANIQSYIQNGDMQVDVRFVHQNPVGDNPYSNPIIATFLTYTTPCSSFPTDLTVSDTTICEGEPLQLGASGGINYDWLPQTGLSCYDCPNPAFTGDSSTVYTVRIWSTDSCSKVLPVHVKVNPKPKFESIQITPSGCGKSTGSIVAMMDTAQAPYQYTLDNHAPQPDSAFTGLASGNYTLSVENVHGCTNDTVLTVGEQLSVTASFIANPATGSAPLWVQTENTSTNATDYLWEWSGGTTTDEHPGFTLDTAGNYTLTLIAYDGAPHCSDTFSLQVLVYDSLQVRIPNIFTPNQDGRNDFFGITTNVSVSGKVSLFNRWGNPMRELEFTTQPQVFEPLWDGTDATEGVYFYQLELTTDIETYSYSGFVQLVR